MILKLKPAKRVTFSLPNIFLVGKIFWHIPPRAWISGRDGGIRAQNFEIPLKRISRAGHSRSVKFSVFRKFLLLCWVLWNFAGFRQNNSVYAKCSWILKISVAEKFMFWRSVVKIANFVDIIRNNSAFTEKKKCTF